jgi:hypothetical protein
MPHPVTGPGRGGRPRLHAVHRSQEGPGLHTCTGEYWPVTTKHANITVRRWVRPVRGAHTEWLHAQAVRWIVTVDRDVLATLARARRGSGRAERSRRRRAGRASTSRPRTCQTLPVKATAESRPLVGANPALQPRHSPATEDRP